MEIYVQKRLPGCAVAPVVERCATVWEGALPPLCVSCLQYRCDRSKNIRRFQYFWKVPFDFNFHSASA